VTFDLAPSKKAMDTRSSLAGTVQGKQRPYLTAGVSCGLPFLTRAGAGGAAGTEFGPSFSAIVEVAIDKGLSLTLRFVSYFSDVL